MGFAAIYIPEFPTLAWLRQEPSARRTAVAVIEGTPPLERVISFNRAARQAGLTHGMGKVQAETSDQVLFHARSLPEEHAALEVLFETAACFSPQVQIIASPLNRYANARQMAAVLLINQTGTETLFGSARVFAETIRHALSRLDFPANVAVAPNAEASLLLARSYAGVTSVNAQEVQTKLAPLPLSMLRIDASVLATLKRWGIRNLGELAALPETAVVSRIGQQGKRLQLLAVGREDHLLVPTDPVFVLSETVALDSPLESLDSLLFILSPMLETLLKQAICHAYALRSVTIMLDLEKTAPHRMVIRPAAPVQSKDLLLKLLNLKLQADPPQSAILGVTMSAEPAIPQVSQRGLFQAQFPEPDKLDLLVARLKSILGEDNVGSPVLSNSYCDDEFVMVPFQPSAEAGSQPKTLFPRAALRRLRPLQQLKVVLSSGIPSLLFWKGNRLELESASGPWHNSGYWWDGRRWEVEEWDAVISQPPHALRLLHEPEHGTWYVAGEYD